MKSLLVNCNACLVLNTSGFPRSNAGLRALIQQSLSRLVET